MTSGRQRGDASGDRLRALELLKHRRTARSRCRRTRRPPRRAATLPRRPCRGSARGSPRPRESMRDDAGQMPRSRRAGRRSAAAGRDARERARWRHRQQPLRPVAGGELGEAEAREVRGAVDQDVARRRRGPRRVDLVQERRVLDDQGVGLGDRLADADRRVVDPAEGDDRRAGALGAERRERLGVAALDERGDRQQLGRGDDALSASPVNPDLEHRG